LKKYTKGIFRMNQNNGVELSGEFSPFLRVCIGVGILMGAAGCFLLAATPFIRAVRWW